MVCVTSQPTVVSYLDREVVLDFRGVHLERVRDVLPGSLAEEPVLHQAGHLGGVPRRDEVDLGREAQLVLSQHGNRGRLASCADGSGKFHVFQGLSSLFLLASSATMTGSMASLPHASIERRQQKSTHEGNQLHRTEQLKQKPRRAPT